ncbi:Na(+)/glucose symporter [Domibacillus indicus]|uniref:sodium:solute symporter family transporter n=1 Tax=Domibacillus indicus TaxID=1437523 RepID=UPI00203B66C3|nr:Na(+)/glucose symporter [Domibacillus indicus]MCM3791102.1 Na(+)/glucose symporter [Domibacillus indicus]
MNSTFAGYGIILGFTVILILISLIISRNESSKRVDEMLTAGRSVPFGLVAASVCVAWIWTGTIMASAEAGVWYGVNGGFNYAWGAVVPFMIFIPIALRLRNIMPRTTTFIEFIRERFDSRLANIYLVFGIALVLYVCVMQAVGIAYAFEYTFHLNYKVVALLSAILFSGFIAIAGLKGSIYNSVFQFFMIMIVIFITMPLIVKAVGLENMYYGMLDAVTNTDHPQHNPDALNFFGPAGWRYGLSAVVIAMGQVVLSQGYYSTAAAASSSKGLFWAYMIGTIIAWLPIPIIFGNVIGGSVYFLQLTPEDLGVSTGVAPYIFEHFLGSFGAVVFVIMIFMAGLTTGGNGLAGVQAMLTLDFYKRYVNKKADERKQMRFGRLVTFAAGIVIGIAAMFLDGMSLLKIDIFSGILFAAPTASLIIGLWSKRLNSTIAICSMMVGLAGGLSAYFMIDNPDLNWFIGNILSLALPFLVILIGLPFSRKQYDFAPLKEYEPEHEIQKI